MNRRAILSLSLSALVLGGTTVGCATDGGSGVASASSHSKNADAGAAAALATKANRALEKGRPETAIGFAEQAVTLRPGDASYRTLLGQSYLKAGRFTSAGQAFGDVLRLTPTDGHAALDLALAQIGTGDWAGARATIAAHEGSIAPGDRGLALALAGDPQSGSEVLLAAAREPGATVTTRQNLGLALALAGHWQEARIVAAADLAPAEVDKRMVEWAKFAQPNSASDQVAALLGVVPVVDAGQPVKLALVAPAAAASQVETAQAEPAEAPAAAPVETASVAAEAAPQPVAAALSAMTQASAPVASADPVPAILPTPGPIRVAVKRTAMPASQSGKWVVQFGAYESSAVARDSWSRIVRRTAALQGRTPLGMTFSTAKGSFYRVSVGGFARTDADRMCRSVKAKGGDCFVRPGAGEQVAAWVRKSGEQLASR